MLDELQRRRLWDRWLSAEVRANYFADLAGVYHRRHRRALWGAVVSSSGAVAAFLAKLPPEWAWVAPALAILTAALSGYSLVWHDQERAVVCAGLHSRWNRLASQYEALWGDMYAPDAPARLVALIERGHEISDSGTAAALPYQEERMLKWQDLVERQHGANVVAA